MSQERRMFAGPAGQLEGVIYRPVDAPAGYAVVCHPHPLYGGDMDNNVVDAVVAGFLAAGWVAARFNFRGVAASTGRHDQGEGEMGDALAILNALREEPGLASLPAAISGYSFGGGVALRLFLADPSITLGIGIAPSTGSLPERGDDDTRPLLIIAGTRDEHASPQVVQTWAGESATQIEVVAGADHFFWGHERAIQAAVTRAAQEALGA